MKEHDLDLLKKGNTVVFRAMFKYYYKPLVIYARSMLKDQDEAEEVVQELFLTIWEKREALTINTSLKSYLFTSVKNRCLGIFKHTKVKNKYRQTRSETINHPAHPDEELMYKETFLKVKKTLENMPDKTRNIFLMNRDEDLTYKEIAGKMKISIKTVEAHVGKALKILRENLRILLLIFYLGQNI